MYMAFSPNSVVKLNNRSVLFMAISTVGLEPVSRQTFGPSGLASLSLLIRAYIPDCMFVCSLAPLPRQENTGSWC